MFNKLDHGTLLFITTTELTMTITVDRIVATCLLSKAATGNEILAVLDMITSTFNQPITPSMMEMIKS